MPATILPSFSRSAPQLRRRRPHPSVRTAPVRLAGGAGPGSPAPGSAGLLDRGEHPRPAAGADEGPELGRIGAAVGIALDHRAIGEAAGDVHQGEAHGDRRPVARPLVPGLGEVALLQPDVARLVAPAARLEVARGPGRSSRPSRASRSGAACRGPGATRPRSSPAAGARRPGSRWRRAGIGGGAGRATGQRAARAAGRRHGPVLAGLHLARHRVRHHPCGGIAPPAMAGRPGRRGCRAPGAPPGRPGRRSARPAAAGRGSS